MIWVSANQRLRAVKLLRQHSSHQHVWPCNSPERPNKACFFQNRGIQPIRSADDKGERGNPRLLPVSKSCRKFFAGKCFARFIQRDDAFITRAGGKQQFGFLSFSRGGILFFHFKLFKRHFPRQTLGIFGVKLRRWRFFSFSNCGDEYFHGYYKT